MTTQDHIEKIANAYQALADTLTQTPDDVIQEIKNFLVNADEEKIVATLFADDKNDSINLLLSDSTAILFAENNPGKSNYIIVPSTEDLETIAALLSIDKEDW